MPNIQGGKKYKSGKGHQEVRAEVHEVDKGQMVGRIVRNSGQRRMVVYCDDNKQRICKIRGGLRKKTWFTVGDIVLISVRDIGISMTDSTKGGERGDILAKYDPTIFNKLKKEYDINPLLFTNIENSGATIAPVDDDDMFEFDNDSDEASTEINIDDI